MLLGDLYPIDGPVPWGTCTQLMYPIDGMLLGDPKSRLKLSRERSQLSLNWVDVIDGMLLGDPT